MSKYEDKVIKRVIEMYNDLPEQARMKVIDTIHYDGIMEAMSQVNKTKTLYFGDLYADAIDRQKNFFGFEGMSTGMAYFDDAIMGLRPGETTVIAGPSNLGKTMVALNIVAQTVIHNNAKVLIISMEMPAIDIASRLYNMTNDHDKLMENIVIQTELDVNTKHIDAMIKRHKPNLVMIDHLHFLANQERGSSEYERINTSMKKVQRLAVSHKLPIILISHVAKTRSGKDGKASASDLKGSSAIEQDSDIVIMLNRTDEQRQTGQLSVELVKQRKKGSRLYFKPVTLEFNGVKLNGNYTENPASVKQLSRDFMPNFY